MLEIKECVIQEEKSGCGAACLATILQTDYWTVAKQFRTDLKVEGLTGQILMDFVAAMGFDVVSKAAIYYGQGYHNITKRILEPFADIHIVAGYQFIEDMKVNESGKTNGHWLILTKEGRLLCPSDGKESTAEFLVFDLNIGMFYPPNWDFRIIKEKQNALDSSSNSIDSSSS